MAEAYLCDAVRTPFGRYGGALSSVRADDLAALPLKAPSERSPSLDLGAVGDVILGCANQAGEDNRNVARMATLLAGWPVEVAGMTVNRLCASGLDAVGSAARAIRCGDLHLAVAGGVESMSRAPFVLGEAESAFSRQARLEDTTIGWRFVNESMRTRHGVDSMPETAEQVAETFGISRADQDALALRSQQRWASAHQQGLFAAEIAPVLVPQRRGDLRRVDTDEHPRPDTTLAALAKLPGVVRPNGTVTAGNASGINDGACALLLASERAAAQQGLTPRARILGMAVAGVAPSLMGYGPAPAVKKLLALTRLDLRQIDVLELNEAFAAQALAVTRELGLADDAEHVNPNGGAIAMGHPLGASGARLVATLMYQLERCGGRYGVATMCVGVGQGVALAIEHVGGH